MGRKPKKSHQLPESGPAKNEAEASISEPEIIEVLPAEAEIISPADLADDNAWLEPEEPKKKKTSRSRDIAPYDSLSAYLSEISRYPVLTREEEHALAAQYYEKKDIESAYKLVSSNLWLVVKIAREYERAARSLLDLIQEGNIGLMEAVKNFDPYRGVRFPSYAAWWIKAYVIRFVIANWRLVKIGTTQAQRKLFFNLKKEKDRLERAGYFPAPKLLAEKLNVKESEIIEMEQRLGSNDVSVDAPLADSQDSSLHSMLPSSGPSAEEMLVKKEMSNLLLQTLKDFSSTLKEKERIIFSDRMISEEKATLQDMSEKLGISRERVRQIENKIRAKLKDYLSQQLGPALMPSDFEQES